jgi:serine phosphatase RsbU (regulator of sigma subunit)
MRSLLPPAVWLAAVGLITSILGLLVLGLFQFQRKQREISLAAFGATSLLYGARVLIEVRLDQFLETPPRTLLFLTAFISYLVVIPLSGFIVHVLGKGRWNSLLWTFRGSIIFAAAGILSDVVQNRYFTLGRLNNLMVIIWAGVVFVNTILPGPKKTRESKIVLAGFLVFGLFALNTNLVSLGLLPWKWSREEIGFLVFLAALGVVAAARFFGNEARLRSLEHELEIARQIQTSILPRTLPSVRGLEMAARYVPAAFVAGDFYDILAPDAEHICVLVADVSGHGLGAAILASMLKIAFSAQQDSLSDPGRVLAGMNQALQGKMEGHFVTAACLFLDLEAGNGRYAAAGHPPMFLCRKNEPEIGELGDNGLVLGPFPDAVFPLTTTALRAGDRIILYTDGVIEARNRSGSFLGAAGFKRFIQDRRSLAPESFASALIDHLSAWTESASRNAVDDDLTLVVLDII